MQKRNSDGFTRCAEGYIARLRSEGRYSTAHVYKNALCSFSRFCGTTRLSFGLITRRRLRRYEQYLSGSGLKPNTISTYMRMLRCIYNQGVERGRAVYIPRLFHDVYTGVDVRQKKALPGVVLHKLLYVDPGVAALRRTQAVATLLFQFCGMSFSDFAHLEKSALRHNLLSYRRVKTHTPVCIEVLECSKRLMADLHNNRPPAPGHPDYLFAVLGGASGGRGEEAHRAYQSALRRFNNQLKRLALALRLNCPVTSYTFRHSWATTAKHLGAPVEMISELLGHKSIKTTQIYLKGFGLDERTRINRLNCSFVMKGGLSRQ